LISVWEEAQVSEGNKQVLDAISQEITNERTADDKENFFAAERVRNIVSQVTLEEFRWQDGHYDHDSQNGRELLFLLANDEWVRATSEIVDLTRSYAIDTAVKIDIDLDQITHEAFRGQNRRFWLPVAVVPPQLVQTNQESSDIRRLEPDPFATVANAAGELLAMLPSVDVRHQIAAAMAEIIINEAVARWTAPDHQYPYASRDQKPAATRDQKLLLAAAVYGLLRRGDFGAAATNVNQNPQRSGVQVRGEGELQESSRIDEEEYPKGSRIAKAKMQLGSLLDYFVKLLRDRISETGEPEVGDGDATGMPRSLTSELTSRTVKVLRAFAESVVLVIPLDYESSPTTITVRVPTRKLKRQTTKKWVNPGTWIFPTRASLHVDVLLPSAAADRLVQLNLPDGVFFGQVITGQAAQAEQPCMVIEVERPQPLRDLDVVMRDLVRDKALPTALQRCLADLALAKADAAQETLRGHWAGSEFDCDSSAREKHTSEAHQSLKELRWHLRQISATQTGQVPTDELGEAWRKFKNLTEKLVRRTSVERSSSRILNARANMIEDVYQRAMPQKAKVHADAAADDSQYLSTAVLSTAMSMLLMAIVLILRLIYPIVPSPEVLAIVLTLFSAIQSARIEVPERSTLRGLLSAVGNRLIVASVLPPVVLAVALGFSSDRIWTSSWAVSLLFFELLMIVVMWRGQRRAKWSSRLSQRWDLTTEPTAYRHILTLQSEWWRSITADALMIGRQAYAYIVPQYETTGASTLKQLLKDPRQGKPYPNLLALVRSGTVGQTMTFMVFRDEPDRAWAADFAAKHLDLDPAGLTPSQGFANTVEVFVAVRPEEPLTLEAHPLTRILKEAASSLPVLEVQFPVPAPSAGYTQWRWARVRVALRGEADIKHLAPFLEAIGSTSVRGALSIGVQTVPGRPRIIWGCDPEPSPERTVIASDMDVVSGTANDPEEGDGTWQVLSICADARSGIESDILRALAQVRPGLRLAGLTYALLYGTAVIFLLGYDPEEGEKIDLEQQLNKVPGLDRVRVPVDERRSRDQLGRAADQPLLRIHFREQDRAGALVDVLDALGRVFKSDLQPSIPPGNWTVWHAQTQVTAGQAAHTRMTIRLRTEPKEADFAEIERKVTIETSKSALDRRSDSPLGGERDLSDDPVISIGLIKAPAYSPQALKLNPDAPNSQPRSTA
jgi:hypothetical protein